MVLANGADSNARNNLHWAVLTKNLYLTKLILERMKEVTSEPVCSGKAENAPHASGCDCTTCYPGVDDKDHLGENPFHIACRGPSAIVAALLQAAPEFAKASMKIGHWTQKTFASGDEIFWQRPLHYAVASARPDLLKVLLTTASPVVDLPNSDGQRPLEIAIQQKDKDATTALLRAGAIFTTMYTQHENLPFVGRRRKIRFSGCSGRPGSLTSGTRPVYLGRCQSSVEAGLEGKQVGDGPISF